MTSPDACCVRCCVRPQAAAASGARLRDLFLNNVDLAPPLMDVVAATDSLEQVRGWVCAILASPNEWVCVMYVVTRCVLAWQQCSWWTWTWLPPQAPWSRCRWFFTRL